MTDRVYARETTTTTSNASNATTTTSTNTNNNNNNNARINNDNNMASIRQSWIEDDNDDNDDVYDDADDDDGDEEDDDDDEEGDDDDDEEQSGRAGPSTPMRRPAPAPPAAMMETENWDDDFEDGTDSPRQLSSSTTTGSSSLNKIPPTPSSLRHRAAHPHQHHPHSHHHNPSTTPSSRTHSTSTAASQIENWDDEFGSLHSSPASKRTTTTTRRRHSYASSSSDEEGGRGDDGDDDDLDDDEAAEFGFNDIEKEEDKTVTARSRRAALSRINPMNLSSSPPPPLPPLTLIPPGVFSNTSSSTHHNPTITTGGLGGLGGDTLFNQPYPRSPTTSVFSVPAPSNHSGRDSSAGYSFSNSLTHLALRPTSSRTSGGGRSSLANLPPSPPLHKARERERRRLRKKSRPPEGVGAGAYEMRLMSEEDEEGVYLPMSFSRDSTPPPPPSQLPYPADPYSASLSIPRHESDIFSPAPALAPSTPPHASTSTSTSASTGTNPSATPNAAGNTNTKTPLLQRIGSVKKKFAVRRKRASTAPSEVALQESSSPDAYDASSAPFGGTELTPRPPSSLSTSTHNTHHTYAQSQSQVSPTKKQSTGPTSSSWFFRGGGGGSGTGGSGGTGTSPPVVSTLDSHFRERDARERGEREGREQGQRSTSSGILLFRQAGHGQGNEASSSSSASASNNTGIGGNGGESPSKLVKRKSFGFVQIRRGINPLGMKSSDSGGGAGESPDSGLARPANSRHTSYGGGTSASDVPSSSGLGLGLGRSPSTRSSKAPIFPIPRNASASAASSSEGGCSSTRGDEREREKDKEREREKEKEGSRGFMGSVRRISLGLEGRRHQRTKSTVSTSGGVPPAPLAGVATGAGAGIGAGAGAGQEQQQQQQRRALSPTPLMRPGSSSSRSPSPMMMSRTSEEDLPMPIPSSGLNPKSNLKGKAKPDASEDEEGDSEPRIGRTRTGTLTLLPAFQLQTPASTLGRSAANNNANASANATPIATTANVNAPHQQRRKASVGTMRNSPQQAASLGRSTMVNAAAVVTAVSSASGSHAASGAGGAGGGSAGAGANGGNGGGGGMRRNSLGDLKIPARITQAQVGLRRDLMMVKEFAANIGQLKELQDTYHGLVTQMNSILDAHHAEVQSHLHPQQQQQIQQPLQGPSPPISPPPTATSGTPSTTTPSTSIFRPKTRQRSNTNPQPPSTLLTHQVSSPQAEKYKQLVSAFYTINSKYRISWECAELLIELGGGATAAAASASGSGATSPSGADVPSSAPPTSSTSEPVMTGAHGKGSTTIFLNGAGEEKGSAASIGVKKGGRERAVTLAGDDTSRPVTPMSMNPSSLPSGSGISAPVGHHHHQHQHHQHQHHHHPHQHGHHQHGQYNHASWRASTGRNDLSSRQLLLLKEMLNNNNSSSEPATTTSSSSSSGYHPLHTLPTAPWDQSVEEPIPEESLGGGGSIHVNRDWRWGDPMSSTITLPASEESGGGGHLAGGNARPITPAGAISRESDISASPSKKRRTSRLGMSGLRDMLRSLKRGHSENSVPTTQSSPRGLGLPFLPPSTASLSTESSSSQHRGQRHARHLGLPLPPLPHHHQQGSSTSPAIPGRRRAKTSTEPASVRSAHAPRPTSPYSSTSLSAKPSPRRPSIASIFRIGKNKSASATRGGGETSSESVDDSAGAGGGAGGGGHHPRSQGASSSSTGDEEEEEDWDRMDVPMDEYDDAARALGIMSRDGTATTVRGSSSRGRSPYMQPGPGMSAARVASNSSIQIPIAPGTPRRNNNASQTSLVQQQHQQQRQTRLSNVEEHFASGSHNNAGTSSSSRQPSRTRPGSRGSPRVPSRKLDGMPPSGGNSAFYASNSNKTGSVRSMPYGAGTIMPSSSSQPISPTPDPKLAMTPENIKPLLENTKEVHARLVECIKEIRVLLDAAHASIPSSPDASAAVAALPAATVVA